MMQHLRSRCIGLDVQKASIAVAIAEEDEAGPTGYALHRQLTTLNIECTRFVVREARRRG